MNVPDKVSEHVPVLVDLLYRQGTQDGPQVTLEGLEDGLCDLILLLAEKLLCRDLQELVLLHDLDLGDPGDSEGDPLLGLHVVTDRVEGHHL